MENQKYELTYLISPDITEKEAIEISKKVEKLASELGLVENSQLPKKIKLAYAIQKKERALLGCFEFQSSPQKLKALKEKVEKMPEVIRLLLVKQKKKSPEKIRKKVEQNIEVRQILPDEPK